MKQRVKPRVALAVVATLVVSVSVVAGISLYWLVIRDQRPLVGSGQQPAPPLGIEPDPRAGTVTIMADNGVAPGPDLRVQIEAPAGATEMQIGFDPTFAATRWLPVAETTVLTTANVGYQMLFARFRANTEAEPSPLSLDGIMVDPTFEAAVSSASGLHRASWARPLSSQRLVIRIEAGRLLRGVQQEYDFADPPPGDRVRDRFGFATPTVERLGLPFGEAVEGSDRLIKTYDQIIGESIDLARLDGGIWLIEAGSGPGAASGQPMEVADVERISRPLGSGRGPGQARIMALVHDLVLALPVDLVPGTTYEIHHSSGLVEPLALVYDPSSIISPAVHVNQAGYGVQDPLKVGYLAGWPVVGGSGLYRAGLAFLVVDWESRAVIHQGQTRLRSADEGPGRGDLTGNQVYELDFSALDTPGRYQVCVEEVGCSEGFEIAKTAWTDMAVLVARAMYHQRSGVALGPPFTSVQRPRPYHPDDGLVVNHTDFRLLDGFTVSLGERFEQLVADGADRSVPQAWGGHFDAGDWDRRIQHLFYARAVAELVEQYPDQLASLDIAIPESGDHIPDLLDEGLWSLDLFQRMQGDDGSIRGGIEASSHPQAGHSSWTDDLAVFAFAPDPWSSYLYAGVAAQMGAVLAPYDPQRAEAYVRSARAAVIWARDQPVELGHEARVAEQRSVATIALYKATGEQHWHQDFLASTTLEEGLDKALSCHDHGRCDAAWIYLTIDGEATDSGLRALIESSFVASADAILATAQQTAFGWALERDDLPLIWGLGPGGSPSSVGLLRAYEITGDERYRAGALRSAAVSLGANPTNTVFVTGVGQNPVRHPLIVDTMNGGLPVWPGTPVYGPHQLNALDDEGWVDEFVLGPAGVEPLAADVPYLWQWFDVSEVAMFNEYTVFQSHAEAIYAFGLLAGAGSEPTG
ncbi:MAG: hypothetical protein GY939_21265 [Actinomycetia bacterium]|nr:hypothetical protein [Actinomycetes bacterium]